MTARDQFGADTTADEVLEGIDLSGRVALVTGGTSGLGAESARALASKGAEVVLTARDAPKGEVVAASIRSSTGNQAVTVEELELADLASVRAFAERFVAEHDSIDILVNNAGVMACPRGATSDGFELQFGTNHLGHFVLTCLIAPTLLNGGPARVVSVSSRGHQRSPVVFDDIGYERREYDKWTAYGQSKTANVLFAVELDRRLHDQGVRAFALHPGAIITELGRHMTAEDMEAMRSSQPGGQLRLKTIPAGAATQVWAATAPELDGQGGIYLEDCGVSPIDTESTTHGVRPYAIDPDNAARLWSVSEEMVGERFDLGA